MKDSIAEVIFNLPIDSGFDYLIPSRFIGKIDVGSRVLVPFSKWKATGYVAALKSKSTFGKLKFITSLIDKQPLVDKNFMKLLRSVSDYYCCSLGEMIEIALPASVRKSKKIKLARINKPKNRKGEKSQVFVLSDITDEKKWEFYIEKTKEALSDNKDIIFIFPDTDQIKNAFEKLNSLFKNNVAVLFSKQSRSQGLKEWLKIKEARAKIVVGAISAIFAPVNDLGLIIIEDEDNHYYKHDQSPHYHVRQVAIMRAKENKASLILSSQTISVETYLEAKKRKYSVVRLKQENIKRPDIQLLDMVEERFRQRKKDLVLSKFLENEINNNLTAGKKTMLFFNRKGFSTYIHCRSCGYTLKCPRCDVALTYHYDKKFLRCRFCNYQTKVVSICPNCQASYMRYLGLGAEKLESEIHRIFPQVRIKRWDKATETPDENFDILISTQIGLKANNISVDLIGALRPESSLNRIDFRAAEKTFSLLHRLSKLAREKMIIQTNNPSHYSIQSAYKDNAEYFYEQELKNRKELGFPPFKHLAQIIIRGKSEERVKAVSDSLFKKLESINKKSSIEIFEPSASVSRKLRGNFYWNILIKGSSIKNICSLIRKPVLEYKNKSGVITTVNVDL